MIKNLLLLFVFILVMAGCEPHLNEPSQYAGTAKRTETNCLNQCDSCSTNDKLELSLDTKQNIAGVSTGASIAFGEKCIYGDAVSWLFKGTYQADEHTFEIKSCNNDTWLAEGGGTFKDGKSSGKVKCFNNGSEDYTVLEWTDVPVTGGK